MANSSRLTSLLAIAACAATGSAMAQVHKCVDAQGKTTFQSRPCDGAPIVNAAPPKASPPASSPSASSPPAPAAAPPKPSVAGAPTEAQVTTFVQSLVSLYATCAALEPGFRARVAGDYGRFREANKAIVEPYERSDELAQSTARTLKLAAENAKEKSSTADYIRKEQAKYCADGELHFSFKWSAPNARLATPEGALQAFIAAVRDGNRRAALEASAGAVGTDVANAPDGGRAQYAPLASWVLVGMEPARGDYVANMRRPDGVQRRVGLVKADANWRVSDLAM